MPKQLRTILLLLVLLLVFFPFVWRIFVQRYYSQFIYSPQTAPAKGVAVVFGAGIYGDGRLTTVLRDRMETAIALYEQGAIDKILVSGDNRFVEYDEPTAMMTFAADRGIPPEDIQPDFGGRRTYDTCYRARHIFQVDSAIVVTQNFHLPRALFICRQLGIDASGVVADRRPYRGARWQALREFGATLISLWDVVWHQPAPVMGEPIPLSWGSHICQKDLNELI